MDVTKLCFLLTLLVIRLLSLLGLMALGFGGLHILDGFQGTFFCGASVSFCRVDNFITAM